MATDEALDVCPSNEGIINDAIFMISVSFAIFITFAGLGHLGSGYPLHELGNRPMGNGGLWSYFYSFITTNVGVKGYDTDMGCFSPPIRIMFHFGFFLVVYALELILIAAINIKFTICSILLNDTSFQSTLFWVSLLIYSLGWTLHTEFSKGVSYPGDPREHKVQLLAKFENKATRIYDKQQKVEWKLDVSKQSHATTNERFQIPTSTNGEALFQKDKQVFSPVSAAGPDGEAELISLGLSGEAVGRQTWSWSESSSSSSKTNKQEFWRSFSKTNDSIVEEMASGGRPFMEFNPEKNPNSGDQIYRAQQIRAYIEAGNIPPDLSQIPKTPAESAKKAAHFFSMLQTDDGHWAGDYGGPHFLMPGYIIVWYAMGKPEKMFDSEQCAMMRHYLVVHQQLDGGWGSHIESPSMMFGTVLCYISLRLLGCDADDDNMVKGRKFIRDQGGAFMASSWAKLWLCILGCMEWEGHNSVPPEMFLLPNWFPFHPGRIWCHCRMVYLPMAYIYGKRFVYSKAETDPLIISLREELYCEPYSDINWDKTRHLVSELDNYSPIPLVMKTLQNLLACYENWRIFQPFKNLVRSEGLKFSFEYMAAEDLQTNFVNLGPVNKALNLLSCYSVYQDTNHTIVQNHMMRVQDYLWLAEDGMKAQGYNGSQLWDTAFAVQAMAECHLLDEFSSVTSRAWSFLERTQIFSTETSRSTSAFLFEAPANRERSYRNISAGSWPFSNSAHGWPVSDCTGEGLKSVFCLMKCKTVKEGIQNGTLASFDDSRFYDCASVLLSIQNEDGGWSTYENNRGWRWYEQLNPSEVFGDIMIDYSYVELTMASLSALSEFQSLYPSHRTDEIKHSIHRGREFIKSMQRSDGSWYGSWGCCFTYACWFGIEGLVTAGEPLDSPSLKLCCDFLLSHQRENGGWGEDFTSCYNKCYAKNGMWKYGDEGSSVVQTAWALLALSCAKCSNIEAIKRGVAYLMKRQLPSGDWPQEGILGVFNRSVGISYTSYRNYFPMWALGKCINTYGDLINDI